MSKFNLKIYRAKNKYIVLLKTQPRGNNKNKFKKTPLNAKDGKTSKHKTIITTNNPKAKKNTPKSIKRKKKNSESKVHSIYGLDHT